jgi:hypothetical protein
MTIDEDEGKKRSNKRKAGESGEVVNRVVATRGIQETLNLGCSVNM